MNKILLTVSLCQDDDSELKPSRQWNRSAWLRTKTDLAWFLDHVEAEAHDLFHFENNETFHGEENDG